MPGLDDYGIAIRPMCTIVNLSNNKNGPAAVNGLTKDAFTITEDEKPQRIISFEAPETGAWARMRAMITRRQKLQ